MLAFRIPSTLILLLLTHITLASPAPKPSSSDSSSKLKLVRGVDTSFYVSEEIYKKAFDQKYAQLIVRGYEEAPTLNPGGKTDPNFFDNVKNAWLAGYREIDAIWEPCSGKSRNCTSYAKQASDFKAYCKGLKMPIKHVWLSIKADQDGSNWNYGTGSSKTSSNMAEAKKMVDALRSIDQSSPGIYTNPDQWKNIFGSYDISLAPDVQLWWFDYSGKQSFSEQTMDDLVPKPKFGGWKKAHAKQFTNKSASGLFNLNIVAVPA